MDDSFTLFAWTLGGTAVFGLLGGLFGGLAGWLHWRSGNASGTFFARRIAGALANLSAREMTDPQRGALIGAVDGAFFLGLFGLLIGLVAGWRGVPPANWLVPLFRITAGLAALAVLFGLLAISILRQRMKAILGLSVGGVGGALLAAHQVGINHIVPGALMGIIAGTLLAALLPRQN